MASVKNHKKQTKMSALAKRFDCSGRSTNTMGTEANTLACHCGTEVCDAAKGLICYSTNGGGSCRPNDVGAYGYPRPASGKCVDVVGRGLIGDIASCSAAASSLGLSETTASEGSWEKVKDINSNHLQWRFLVLPPLSPRRQLFSWHPRVSIAPQILPHCLVRPSFLIFCCPCWWNGGVLLMVTGCLM